MKTVQLTPEIADLIQQQVQTGKYADDLAVIQAGLQLLAERDRIYRGRFAELQQDIMIGVEDLQQGKSFDGREVIERLKRENAQRMDNE